MELRSSPGKQDPGLWKTVLVLSQWTVTEIKCRILIPHGLICDIKNKAKDTDFTLRGLLV